MDEVELDEYHAHEALDRTFVSSDQFDTYVCNHPFVLQTPHLKEQAERISLAMFDLYQAISNESRNKYENNN